MWWATPSSSQPFSRTSHASPTLANQQEGQLVKLLRRWRTETLVGLIATGLRGRTDSMCCREACGEQRSSFAGAGRSPLARDYSAKLSDAVCLWCKVWHRELTQSPQPTTVEVGSRNAASVARKRTEGGPLRSLLAFTLLPSRSKNFTTAKGQCRTKAPSWTPASWRRATSAWTMEARRSTLVSGMFFSSRHDASLGRRNRQRPRTRTGAPES